MPEVQFSERFWVLKVQPEIFANPQHGNINETTLKKLKKLIYLFCIMLKLASRTVGRSDVAANSLTPASERECLVLLFPSIKIIPQIRL